MPDPVAELYTAPPDGFVAARAELVAAAKAAGQTDRAKQLGKLRKPTVAAWVVNLLALRRPELVDQLVELSAALRSAQRQLKGDALRELTKQRREAVGALVKEAVALATKADPGNRGKLPVAEVEATLTAAVSDAEVAEQVRSGRLVRAASYAGFGEVPRPNLRLVTDEQPEPLDAADDGDGDGAGSKRAAEAERAARRRAVERELTTALAAQKSTAKDLDKAGKAETDGEAVVERAEAALQEAERARADADAALGRLRAARKAAERAAAQARRRVGEVEAALEAMDEE
ncbi:hypothetical protein SAMN05421684_3159 [Asanoa ishikariensis]|uniref:Uncharacterized protein n=1 Tax=Asanoa ishikariensis TaxID=137265 RepID=A0A1H3QTV8_9ACTN|nr:hypothetical protein [Asanoa ishikariensis]SDZ16491.1 hypothetical protein SAMN05421684_3159 [Asanoa ishikariensis]